MTDIKTGGGYVENEDHVPSLTDQEGQYNTSGLGAHQRLDEISSAYRIDKVNTAEQIVAALDPEDDSVSSDKVVLPDDPNANTEAAKRDLLAKAEAAIERGAAVNEPGPAEAEAAEETDENVRAEGGGVGTVAGEQASPTVTDPAGAPHETVDTSGLATASSGGDEQVEQDTTGSGTLDDANTDAESTYSEQGGDDQADADAQDGGVVDGDDLSSVASVDYTEWEYVDLQKEVSRRNEEREDADKIEPESRKAEDLAAALKADDEAYGR